jgi:putative transcriptional regulator
MCVMTTSPRPKLANRIRVARAERNLSQDELARAVEVSRNTIGSIETGRYTPSALLAFRIAEALDIPVTTLFWIEGATR